MNQSLRISPLSKVALIVIAALFDLAELGINLLHLIPFIGSAAAIVLGLVLSIATPIIFGIWFLLLGVGFTTPARAGTGALATLIEFIPGLNILPATTIGVITIILLVELEAKLATTGVPFLKKSKQ